jgi:hypothetical protein
MQISVTLANGNALPPTTKGLGSGEVQALLERQAVDFASKAPSGGGFSWPWPPAV